MKKYSIGAVSAMLNVKPHVLRYWEKEFPFIKPVKSKSGRRVYSESEIHLLFRLRYLLYEKTYGLAEAKNKIWEELAAHTIDFKLAIRELRGQVLDLYERLDPKKTNDNL